MCINLRKSFYKGGERCRWLQVFCAQLSRSSKLPPFVPPLQLRASHICIVTFTFSLLRQQKRQFSSKDQSETPSGSQSVNQRNSRLLHIHKPRHNWSQKRNAKLNTCFTTFLPAFWGCKLHFSHISKSPDYQTVYILSVHNKCVFFPEHRQIHSQLHKDERTLISNFSQYETNCEHCLGEGEKHKSPR